MSEIIKIKKAAMSNNIKELNSLLSLYNNIEEELSYFYEIEDVLSYVAENGFTDVLITLFNKLDHSFFNSIKILLKNKKEDIKGIEDAFYMACINGHEEIAELIINEPNINLSLNGYGALIQAVENNSVFIFNLIVNHKTFIEDNNINQEYRDDTKYQKIQNSLSDCLYVATKYDLEHFCHLILKEYKNKTYGHLDISIHKAAFFNSVNILKTLLSNKKIDPTFGENKAITSAFNKKNNNAVALLWKDERVKNTLKKDNIDLYNFLKIENNITNFI